MRADVSPGPRGVQNAPPGPVPGTPAATRASHLGGGLEPTCHGPQQRRQPLSPPWLLQAAFPGALLLPALLPQRCQAHPSRLPNPATIQPAARVRSRNHTRPPFPSLPPTPAPPGSPEPGAKLRPGPQLLGARPAPLPAPTLRALATGLSAAPAQGLRPLIPRPGTSPTSRPTLPPVSVLSSGPPGRAQASSCPVLSSLCTPGKLRDVLYSLPYSSWLRQNLQ